MRAFRIVTGGLAAAALCLAVSALRAEELVATAPIAAVKIPYGDWIISIAQLLTSILVPAAITAATAAIYQVFPAARLFVSTSLVERLVRNAVGYGMNSVEGAVKDKALSVPVGSAVLANALNYSVTQAKPWLLKMAGGEAGLAEKIFRSLHLQPQATAANVLAPALGLVSAPIDAGEAPAPRARRTRAKPAPAEA